MNNIDRYSHQIIKEANQHQGDEPSASFVEAFNAVAELPTKEERKRIRLQVIKSLNTVKSDSGAGFIGIWLGGVVENGADPEPFIPHLLQRFTEMIKQLTFTSEVIDEEEGDDEVIDTLEDTKENDERIIGLQYLGQSLVAHISRCPKLRDEITNNDEIMQLLEDNNGCSVGIRWVYELLIKHSDDLIVLHAEENIAVKVRYKNISNCFHLFTLLQEAIGDIMPHEKTPDDISSAYTCWWHYGQANSPEASIMSSVWGEMPPRHLITIDGVKVMLLWSSIMAARSWDEGFLHPELEAAPASLEVVELLSEEDVLHWRKQLNL